MRYTEGRRCRSASISRITRVFARVWKATIGRIALYLLDTT
jgi:hypothetical protein